MNAGSGDAVTCATNWAVIADIYVQGAPACVKVYSRAQLGQETPVGRRSFFKSNSAKILWNRGSTAVLIVAQTDVDKSNQSYYGESRLHFISSNGSYEGTVPLSKITIFFGSVLDDVVRCWFHVYVRQAIVNEVLVSLEGGLFCSKANVMPGKL